MRRILLFAIFVLGMLMSMCYALEEGITNAQVNADTNAGVSTSMNGNTNTGSGTSISSTSASATTRHTSGGNY